MSTVAEGLEGKKNEQRKSIFETRKAKPKCFVRFENKIEKLQLMIAVSEGSKDRA